MKKVLISIMVLVCGLAAMAQSDSTVEVLYNGTTATVSIADNVSHYLTVTQQGAHVSIAQSDSLSTEITYNLSGSSSDGEFYMSGSYKATLELNGLTLTNTTPVYSGAAIHIQNGKRINVKVISGTTNTLVDAASGSQKGCLYVKGHAEFKQLGTLNVVGNVKHAIKAGEYISVKQATVNVTSAVGDGISCNQYFLMESGIVNISGTGDDGLQCDLDGDTSTGVTANHEDEDSGNIYIEGGTITINCSAIAAKGIKSAGDIYITDEPVINVTTSGKGTWDEDDLETKAACGISADGNIDISGGIITLTATGSGGKGMKCDSIVTVSGGDITVATSGGLYYNDGTTENTNYTGNTDNISSNYYSSPKGIKAGVKTQVGNSYTYSGGIVISDGYIIVTTSSNNAYGMLTPAYFCIDNFNGEAPTPPTPPQDEPPYIVNPVDDVVFNEYPETIQVNLEGVATDDDNDDELIAYTLVSNSNTAELSAEISGKTLILNRLSREEATATLVLRATSNGLYVDFNVNVIINFVPDGIEENELHIAIYPNPAHDIITVEMCHGGSVQGINICDITGKMILATTESRIDISALPEGVYFITVFTENQRFVEKIIKK